MDSEEIGVAEPLHFKNPPIVEAVIAITVSPLPDDALERFAALKERFQELGYTVSIPMSQSEFQMKIDSGRSVAETRDTPHGWRYHSSDGLHVAQFTRTGFIFSRLGKYESWDLFRSEGKKLWEFFEAEIGAAQLTGYGVRYINKVFLPVDEEISLYLKIYPKVPDDVPPTIIECFMRLGMPISDLDGKLVHQQIRLPTEKPGYATVILDNDFSFPVLDFDAEAIWERLETVRRVKDDYFRKFVTQRLMETFNA